MAALTAMYGTVVTPVAFQLGLMGCLALRIFIRLVAICVATNRRKIISSPKPAIIGILGVVLEM